MWPCMSTPEGRIHLCFLLEAFACYKNMKTKIIHKILYPYSFEDATMLQHRHRTAKPLGSPRAGVKINLQKRTPTLYLKLEKRGQGDMLALWS